MVPLQVKEVKQWKNFFRNAFETTVGAESSEVEVCYVWENHEKTRRRPGAHNTHIFHQ